MATKVIKNVHVFNGESLSELTHVVIKDGYISSIGPAVPEGAEEYNAKGATLLPGYIDTHIHIDSRENCVLAVQSGITTLIDQMCDNTALIDSLDDPAEPISSVKSVYMPVQSQDGPMKIEALGYESPYAETQEDVHRIIDGEIAKGAIVVKLILDVPPLTKGMLSEELIDETVRYAHQRGKLVSAHCTTVEAYRRAAKYGVDILNHIPKDEQLPQVIIDEIRDRRLVVIPTMVMQEGMVQSLQKVMPQRAGNFANVTDAVRRMHEAGITLLVGTDSNNTNALCHIRHGESILHEFELLKEAGLTDLEILQGVTTDAARIFGLTDRGTIEVGKRADLVLVEGHPTQDISACRNIQKVWVKGIEAE